MTTARDGRRQQVVLDPRCKLRRLTCSEPLSELTKKTETTGGSGNVRPTRGLGLRRSEAVHTDRRGLLQSFPREQTKASREKVRRYLQLFGGIGSPHRGD